MTGAVVREVCERSELIWVHGEPYLVTPATPELMDDLAAVDADAAEREEDTEDACGCEDYRGEPWLACGNANQELWTHGVSHDDCEAQCEDEGADDGV